MIILCNPRQRLRPQIKEPMITFINWCYIRKPVIPEDLFEEIAIQDLHTLYEIKELVDHLISKKETAASDRTYAQNSKSQLEPSRPSRRSISKSDNTSTNLVEERRLGSVTYRLEWVLCGKGCKGCPHGPYWYCYWKEDGKTKSKYIGKTLKELI